MKWCCGFFLFFRKESLINAYGRNMWDLLQADTGVGKWLGIELKLDWPGVGYC